MVIMKKRILESVIFCVVLVFAGVILWNLFLKNEKNISVVYIPKVYDETNDFWVSVVLGAESAAKEHQVDLTIMAPAEEDDSNLQIRYIEEAIRMKPDVIAISPILYSGMTDEVKKINKANIPLVLIDSKLDESIEDCCISTNNVEMGEKAGTKTLEYIDDTSKIVIMSYVKDSSTAIERQEGFRKALGDKEKNIEEVLYCGSDYEKSYELSVEYLSEHKDVDCMVGLNLYSTIGVARAVKALGLEDQIEIVGIDNDIECVQYLEEGVIDAIIVQKPYHMGYFGICEAVALANGKKVEKITYSETEIITLDNIYTEKNEKLLFLF